LNVSRCTGFCPTRAICEPVSSIASSESKTTVPSRKRMFSYRLRGAGPQPHDSQHPYGHKRAPGIRRGIRVAPSRHAAVLLRDSPPGNPQLRVAHLPQSFDERVCFNRRPDAFANDFILGPGSRATVSPREITSRETTGRRSASFGGAAGFHAQVLPFTTGCSDRESHRCGRRTPPRTVRKAKSKPPIAAIFQPLSI